MGVVLGIDYGMSETKVSYVDENGKLCHLRSSEGTDSTPSAFYAVPNRDEVLVGAVALMEGAMDPENLVINSKGDIRCDDYKFCLGAGSYTSKDILEAILKQVVRDAEEQLGDVPIDGAVLSCPAYFKEPDRRNMREAKVELSNGQRLTLKGLVDDPTATVISYCESLLPSCAEGINKTFLVYDLGAAFDATVVKVSYTRDEKKIDILGIGGDHEFGVPNWVHAIKSLIIDRSCDAMGIDPSDMWADPDMRYWLENNAEMMLRRIVKKGLSTVTVAYNDEKVKVEITRDDLINETESYIGFTISIIDHTLNACQRTIYDIDEILVVGGGARLPYVYESLEAEYGRPIVVLDSPYVISDGAALVGAGVTALAENAAEPEENNIIISDLSGMTTMGMLPSTYRSYYIKVGESTVPYCKIGKDEQLPAQSSELLLTEKADQTEFVVRIFENSGDPDDGCEDEYEAYYPVTAELQPGLPKGSPIQIILKIDCDGKVEICLVDTVRGNMVTALANRIFASVSDSVDDLNIF